MKAVAVAFRTVQGYKIMKQAEKVNWSKRLDDLAHPHESFQALHGKEDLSYGFDKHVYKRWRWHIKYLPRSTKNL